MAITKRAVGYTHKGTALEGVLAVDEAKTGKRPAVLISHAWAGRTANEVAFAEKIAKLGYAGFALDLYGKGVTGSNKDENTKLMTPFMQDRAMLQARMQAVVDVARDQPEVDARKIVAMGFCFGGLCVLDLARAGADIQGIAAFHGLLKPPGNTDGKVISARVVAFHGWDDPMAPPEDVVALGKELTKAKADWQVHAYGNTVHAFTNPEADDPGFGTVYNKKAADRSWESFTAFARECFA